MTALIENRSPKSWAKMAGLLYLLIAIAGAFSIAYVPSEIMVEGDPAATAGNIMAKEGLFRMGIFGDIAVIIMEVIVTVILYRLFKPVNQLWSMMAAFSRFAMTFVMGVNLLNLLIPAYLLTDAGATAAFETEELHALVMLFLEMHALAIYIWGIFFGLHLFFLGRLLLKAAYFPNWIGYLIFIGSFGYIAEPLARFVIPGVDAMFYIYVPLLTIVTIAELSFTFYLLIKGMVEEEWPENV